MPITTPPDSDDIDVSPGNTSLTAELERLRDRIKQLEQARSKDQLDKRFSDIRDLIKKGDDQNAGEITAIKTDMSTLVTGLQTQNRLLEQIAERVNKGVGMQVVKDGQAGPIVFKPLGEVFRLNSAELKAN